MLRYAAVLTFAYDLECQGFAGNFGNRKMANYD
jgi:hypothetical protein